jgi:hypothetical protein
MEGHFLGYQLLRVTRDLLGEMPAIAAPLTRSFVTPGGGSVRERLAGMGAVLSALAATVRDPREDPVNDPVVRARIGLQSDPPRLQALEERIIEEIDALLSPALLEAAA